MKPEEKEPRKKRRKSGDVEEMGDGDDFNYLFVCNRWLARDEDDGQIVRELVPVDVSGKPRRSSLAGKVNAIMIKKNSSKSHLLICKTTISYFQVA